MTGRPDTTDRIDRMEHDGNRFFEFEWLGENGQPAGVLYEAATDLAEHVLALVAVARAARGVMTQMDYETPHHTRLREALARLDGAR